MQTVNCLIKEEFGQIKELKEKQEQTDNYVREIRSD